MDMSRSPQTARWKAELGLGEVRTLPRAQWMLQWETVVQVALTPLPVILWGFLLNTFAFGFDMTNYIVTRQKTSKKKQVLQELTTQKKAVANSTDENVAAVTCV